MKGIEPFSKLELDDYGGMLFVSIHSKVLARDWIPVIKPTYTKVTPRALLMYSKALNALRVLTTEEIKTNTN